MIETITKTFLNFFYWPSIIGSMPLISGSIILYFETYFIKKSLFLKTIIVFRDFRYLELD